MEKLSGFVLRHQLAMGLLSLLGFVAGVGATVLTVPRLTSEFAYPGMPSYEANQEILRTYGNGGEQRPFVPVVTLPQGQTVESPAIEDALRRAFDAVAERLDARVASYADTADGYFVGRDGRTTFGLVYTGPTDDGSPPGGGLGEVPDETPAIVEAMRAELPAGTAVRVTGLDTLAPGTDVGGVNVPLTIGIGVLAALVVLVLVFRSALALVPILVATVAIPFSYLAALALTTVAEPNSLAFSVMPLIGLGIAIDYSLLVVTRWREERARGYGGDEAVRRAMGTAGHAVLLSGGAVVLGLMTMIVLPVPFLRSLGYAGVFVVASSVLVSLTLLPVILAWAGRRLDRKHRGAAGAPGMVCPGREASAGRGWCAWARGVIRFRWLAALATCGVLLALALTGLGMNMRVPESGDLARSGSGHDGLIELERARIPSAVLTPIDVLVPSGTEPSVVASELEALPGVEAAVAPDDADWRHGGTAMIGVFPTQETGSAAGEETIVRIRDALPARTRVGGNAAQNMDSIASTYGAFPLMLGLISLVTFVMLARAFRSLLLPLKAILLNLLSLGAVMGAMVLLWQYGFGTERLLGLPATGSIGQFVPVTIFAFLYGLSMDYEVFILARMREEYDRTGSTREAVVEGIGRTGRLVTSAALILFLSFAALASGPELDVKVFASGLALGILLDATLIRALLVPAVVSMMGRWNWWLPGWAARVLRVRPSPLRD